MLFESYLVFLTLEVLVIAIAYLLYFKEPKPQPKKLHDPWKFIENNY